MAVKIRLRRDGAKKRPFYHVVAADERRARNGRFIEELGYYNPIVAADVEPILVLKEDRIRYWLSVGAQPSETAAGLLKKRGLIARIVPKPKPVVADTTPTEETTQGADTDGAEVSATDTEPAEAEEAA